MHHKGINFTLWDVGGLPKIRHLWPHYYANNDAVIFVVDSQDQVRLPEAKKELADWVLQQQKAAADDEEDEGEEVFYYNKHFHTFNNYNKAVWSGCLSQDRTNIIWKDTGHNIPFHSHKGRCFWVDDNIFLSRYHYGGNKCNLNNYDYDRYKWEEKKYYRNMFSLPSSLNEYTGESGNIGENKQFIMVAARINHLMKREGRHVSVWFPVGKIYSRRQTLVFTRNGDSCESKRGCGCGCRHFRKRHSEANSISLLPFHK